MGRLIHQAFVQMAAQRPQGLALVCGDHRVDYATLLSRTQAVARLLQDHGVARADRVLILLEAGIEYVVALHAVWLAGAVAVPVNPTTKADKLAFLLQDTEAKALLTHGLLAGAWLTLLQRPGSLQLCCAVNAPAWPHAQPPCAALRPWPTDDVRTVPTEAGSIDQDLATLIYTSGTTGRPKGVMLTHLNMASAWDSVQAYLGLRADDVIGLALQPAFSYGLYNLVMGVGLGATVVIERHAAFPARLAETIARERVTVLPGVPTLFAALLGLEHFDRLDLRSLRLVTNAAAALPEAHLRLLHQRLPHVQMFSMYGLTECARASFLPPQDVSRKPASVGRGMPNQDHWLVDDTGVRLGPQSAAVGELVVRGSHVMRGYWRRPEETAERLRPGPIPGEVVLHTGDLFRTDDEGYLYFVARRDDIIKSRGEKVAPREIEEALYRLPEVSGCAVVGVPDETLGQAVKAYVTLRTGCTLSTKDITRHCQRTLENHMVPKFVDIVPELPRTDSGKIRHASLREPAPGQP